jgi:hypothetical protein
VDGFVLDDVSAVIGQAAQENNWVAHEEEFRGLLPHNQDRGPLYYALAMAAFEKGKHGEAETLARRALAHSEGSDWITAATLQGLIWVKLQKLEKAETIFQQALERAEHEGLLAQFGERLSAELMHVHSALIGRGNQGSIKSVLRSQILDGTQVSECRHALGLVKQLEFTLRPGIVSVFAWWWSDRWRRRHGADGQPDEAAGLPRVTGKSTHLRRAAHFVWRWLLVRPLYRILWTFGQVVKFAFGSALRSLISLALLAAAGAWIYQSLVHRFAACVAAHRGAACDPLLALTGVSEATVFNDTEQVLVLIAALLCAVVIARLAYLYLLARSICYVYDDATIILKHGVLHVDVKLIELIYSSGYEIHRSALQRLLQRAELHFISKDTGVNNAETRPIVILGPRGAHQLEQLMVELRGLNRVLHSINRIKNLVG